MGRLLAVTVLLSTALAQAVAQTGPYLFDLPKLYSQIFRLWTESLPYAIDPLPDWLSKFNGTVSPIRDVSVGGSAMKFATTCKPHDCADNIAGVLFNPRQPRILAVVLLNSKSGARSMLVIGQMSGAEVSCIQRLI
jgi:inhibitor of lysozyme (Ivy)